MEQAQGHVQAGAAVAPPLPVVVTTPGVVAAVLVQPGDVVTAGQTTALVTGERPLMVAIRVSEDDADRIDVGRKPRSRPMTSTTRSTARSWRSWKHPEAAGGATIANALRGADLRGLAASLGLADVAELERLAQGLMAQAGAGGLGAGADGSDDEAATGDEDEDAAERDADAADDEADAGEDEDDDLPFVVLIAVDDPDEQLEAGTEVDVRIELD